jgi:hypothetical protein
MNIEGHGGMLLSGETEELGENSVPVSLFQTKIPHRLARERTWASEVKGQILNALAMARPCLSCSLFNDLSVAQNI